MSRPAAASDTAKLAATCGSSPAIRNSVSPIPNPPTASATSPLGTRDRPITGLCTTIPKIRAHGPTLASRPRTGPWTKKPRRLDESGDDVHSRGTGPPPGAVARARGGRRQRRGRSLHRLVRRRGGRPLVGHRPGTGRARGADGDAGAVDRLALRRSRRAAPLGPVRRGRRHPGVPPAGLAGDRPDLRPGGRVRPAGPAVADGLRPDPPPRTLHSPGRRHPRRPPVAPRTPRARVRRACPLVAGRALDQCPARARDHDGLSATRPPGRVCEGRPPAPR